MPTEGEPAIHTTDKRYGDTVSEALERLAVHGPEWGPARFAFHAPMAAEALAALGYCDEVPQWIEQNRAIRQYSARPEPRRPIDPDDPAEQMAARGDSSRFADWTKMFDAQLATKPWREVLARWWPRLLPGMFGSLGHGMIRTAHAVRVLSSVAEPTPAQLGELAQGLGFWAARYWSPSAPGPGSPFAAALAVTPPLEQTRAALMGVAATAAGILADHAPTPIVPLIHMITIPAAVDLVLPALPPDLHADSYRFAVGAAAATFDSFGSHLQPAPVVPADAVPPLRQIVEAAVETGDEHAIKLADVSVRSAAADLDSEPYRRAVATVLHRMGRGI